MRPGLPSRRPWRAPSCKSWLVQTSKPMKAPYRRSRPARRCSWGVAPLRAGLGDCQAAKRRC
eukprot:4399783-Lingulodinium_polyedra.AAC.1